ncbi:MAG: hypothetical protein MUO89_07745 [Dehalococcoidia bacterium]|nr:hypothetical protein [Dehalococcoidia bacterium]
MPEEYVISIRSIKIGSNSSVLSVCRDGYSLSSSPVPGIETSEVLARVNEFQPLTSTDGSYQNEILKSVFNIGLKRSEVKPLWIIPNSIRHYRYNSVEKSGRKSMASQMSPDECTLHRQFAGLAIKKETEILNFANKYGLLRRHPVHNLVFRERDIGRQVQLGESLLWWQEEISDLAGCLRLWDMVSSSDRELKDIVLWHRDGIALRLDDNYLHLVGRKNMNLLNRWHRGDLKGPALYYISLEMDRHLLNTLTPRMPDPKEREIFFFPNILLSAIWFMFLLEVSGGTRLLRCDICGEYFNTYDPRTRFCSTRCRMRNYRSAQKSKARKKIKGVKKT